MDQDGYELIARAAASADLASLLGQAGEAIALMDEAWVVRYCNDVYLRNTGLPASEVIGRTPFDYVPQFARSIFYEAVVACQQGRRPMCRIGYSTVLGRWLMVRVFPVDGGSLLLANDATDTVVKQHQLAQQALTDPLTGLPNKLRLLQDVASAIALHEPFSVTILALDRFDAVTDVLGYAGGDLALMEVASRLQSASAAPDRIYKLPGQEFAVFSRPGIADAVGLASLQRPVRTPFVLQDHAFVLDAHAGCARAADTSGDAEQVLRHAALALRQAARDGKGAGVFYTPALEVESLERQQLESELRTALRERQLTLFLQPKGQLSDGRLAGAEVLIRWPHATRGMVSPGDFLPLAHDCGLMPELDAFVIDETLRMVAALPPALGQLPVSINLSAESLSDGDLGDRIRGALQRWQVLPARVEIEIPEGALMRDVDASARALAPLAELGVRISIDDFGTRYSSFAYLARFPVHTLKIDRSFITGVDSHEVHAKIVRGIIRLAHSLQLQVVAEGAETDAEIERLRRLHCDVVQGFGYGRPMPLPAFLAFAEARQATAETVSAFVI
jgi:diguanylate cyclase (GGDEF)-like protein